MGALLLETYLVVQALLALPLVLSSFFPCLLDVPSFLWAPHLQQKNHQLDQLVLLGQVVHYIHLVLDDRVALLVLVVLK